MRRATRILAPGFPHHVTQRGCLFAHGSAGTRVARPIPVIAHLMNRSWVPPCRTREPGARGPKQGTKCQKRMKRQVICPQVLHGVAIRSLRRYDSRPDPFYPLLAPGRTVGTRRYTSMYYLWAYVSPASFKAAATIRSWIQYPFSRIRVSISPTLITMPRFFASTRMPAVPTTSRL